jgi:chorismate synthase
MSGNSIGAIFRLTTFGESHSNAVGGVIDGCPSGLVIDPDFIRQEMKRRNPDFPGTTSRKETDEVEFLSGIENKTTLGTPIAFAIRNTDGKSSDYKDISTAFRPSHADYTYFMKYGKAGIGGGRASGRETAARVVGGAVAKLFLKKHELQVRAEIESIGGLRYDSEKTAALIKEAKTAGDTLGGTITCKITGVPVGLGEPVFDKLQADLAKAMLSIGSAKGFEYGKGFAAARMEGSEYNDLMTVKDGKTIFLTNHDGGIQGGISNGQEIFFKVGFKPVPSLSISQSTVNQQGEPATIKVAGRHDTCHVPRLVVIVEAMAALVIADHLLRSRIGRID